MASRYPKEERVKRVFRFTNHKKKTPPRKQLPEALKDENCTTVLNPEILRYSERFHKYYRMHSKQKRKLPLHSCTRLIEEVFKEVRRRMINNEAGVFLEGLGYFCMMRVPEKKVHKFRMQGAVFYGKYIYALGATYKPIFIPIRKDGGLKSFVMDRGFNESFKKSLYYQITRKGKKYRMMFTILQNLYGRENVKAIIPNRK